MVHIIKVYLQEPNNEQQIRRLAVSSDIVSSFQLLKVKVKALFQIAAADFEMKWKDTDNDLISMSSDEELAQAVANADDGLLKLFVILKNGLKIEKAETPLKPTEKEELKQSASSSNNDGEAHIGVVCDSCDSMIRGARYKCLQCKDFDLCSSCNSKNQHTNHDMIKLVKPVQHPREWIFLGARRMWRSMFGRVPRGFHASSTHCGASLSSSSEESADDYQKAFSDFIKGDFVPAQNLLTETFGSFLKNFQGVDVKLDHPLFKQPACNKKQKTDEKVTKPSEETPEKKADDTPSTESACAKPDAAEVEPALENPTGLFSETKSKVDELNTAVKSLVLGNKPSTQNENLIDLKEQPQTQSAEPVFVDGWTLLQREDASMMTESTPTITESIPVTSVYPALEKIEAPVAAPAMDTDGPIYESFTQCKDPKIVEAVVTMMNMGFTNESGWLEKLLVSKGGDIVQTLEALYPTELGRRG